MDLISTKILVAILFGVLRLFFGTLPIKLYQLLTKWEGEIDEEDPRHFINQKRHEQVTCALTLCQSFGGGVLFATAFLHMMPDVYISVEELKKDGNFYTNYPLSQLTVSCGFFFVYFVEEFSHWFVTKVPEVPCKTRTITPVNEASPVKEKAPVTPQERQENGVFIIENKIVDNDAINDDNLDNVSVKTDIIKENEKNQIISMQNDEIVREQSEKQVITRQQYVRYILITLALSLHAIFEGLSIGLQNSTANIWYMFTAVSIHSATILFYIGMELILAKAKKRTMIIHISVLSTPNSLGVLLGLLITSKANVNSIAKSIAVVLLEGLSAGTILYITFFEILNREKSRRTYRLRRAVCILGGFAFMAILQAIESGADE